VDKPFKYVTNGQCDARPTVTFPVTGHRFPAAGTRLYCLVTEAQVYEQLAQDRYLTAKRPFESQANALTIAPPGHRYCCRIIYCFGKSLSIPCSKHRWISFKNHKCNKI